MTVQAMLGKGGGIYVGSVNGEFQFTRVIISENVALGYGGINPFSYLIYFVLV